jgi:hypothetical protein
MKGVILNFNRPWVFLSASFFELSTNKCLLSWVLVAHTCNPSYSGDRDQEDRGSKPAQANSLQDSILKIPNVKKG